MTAYSHAAIEWAATHPCAWSAAGFDAGAASVTAPEPVRLTDPDDPRNVAGARVRIVMECTVSGETYADTSPAWVAGHIRGVYRPTVGVYLLAEAPDPDADALEALNLAYNDQCNIGEMLDALRAAGYDVTKRADA